MSGDVGYGQFARRDVLVAKIDDDVSLILLQVSINFTCIKARYGLLAQCNDDLDDSTEPYVLGANFQVEGLRSVIDTQSLIEQKKYAQDSFIDKFYSNISEYSNDSLELCKENDGKNIFTRVRLFEALSVDDFMELWVSAIAKIIGACESCENRIICTDLKIQDMGEIPFLLLGERIWQFSESDIMREGCTSSVTCLTAESLLDMVHKQQEGVQSNNPLINTYGQIMTAPETLARMRFLLLIETLEGLYNYKNDEDIQERKRVCNHEFKKIKKWIK